MKKLFTLAIILLSFATFAQSGYVVDPVTKKRVTYVVKDGIINYSNGRTATPSISSTDFKAAYLNAALPPVGQGIKEIIPESGKQLLLGQLSNVSVKIKPGTYSDIWIYLEKGTNVKIDATGVTFKNCSMTIGSIENFELYGATFIDQSYRAISIEGFSNEVKLHDLSFKNIGDYVITYQGKPVFDGTDKTVSKNWTIEKCSFINTSQAFSAGGDYTDQGVIGVFKNFKFLNNTIKDCPAIGTVVWVGAADNYEIAGNLIDHINYVFDDPNAKNGYHWGIFAMNGNGSFHDNKVTNHSGNLIRAWGVSFGSTIKDILIYNNIAYSSHKYSAFELQSPPWMTEYREKYPNRIKVTNARVYNNTAGKMNTSKDWEGQMLDLYNTGGSLYYFNNSGFNMNRGQGPITDMINNMSDVIIHRNDGNIYKTNWQDVVSDLTTFKSKLTGIGAQ